MIKIVRLPDRLYITESTNILLIDDAIYSGMRIYQIIEDFIKYLINCNKLQSQSKKKSTYIFDVRPSWYNQEDFKNTFSSRQ